MPFVICSKRGARGRMAVGRMDDDGHFNEDGFDGGRPGGVFAFRVCARRGASVGAEAGHGLFLRQGRKDTVLQNGHQQCRHAAERRQEGAEGHVVLRRREWAALHADRPLSRGRRQVQVRVELTLSSFFPCGRRWREAPDEGYLTADTDPSSVSLPLRGHSRCKTSAYFFKPRRPPMPPSPTRGEGMRNPKTPPPIPSRRACCY